VFDLQGVTGEEAAAPTFCAAHPDSVTCGTWTNDEHLVVSGGEDGVLRMWDLRSSAAVQEHAFAPGSPVNDMEMTSDGNMLAVAAGKSVVFFNVTNPGNLEVVKTHTCKLAVESVSVHPEKTTFLTAGTDLWVYEYDFETMAEVDCKKGHHGPVHVVKYATDGKSYASGADDATLRLWTKNDGGGR
jgi:serine-threonine kinase receptor-associated protein